jgi:hypothetical protein
MRQTWRGGSPQGPTPRPARDRSLRRGGVPGRRSAPSRRPPTAPADRCPRSPRPWPVANGAADPSGGTCSSRLPPMCRRMPAPPPPPRRCLAETLRNGRSRAEGACTVYGTVTIERAQYVGVAGRNCREYPVPAAVAPGRGVSRRGAPLFCCCPSGITFSPELRAGSASPEAATGRRPVGPGVRVGAPRRPPALRPARCVR